MSSVDLTALAPAYSPLCRPRDAPAFNLTKHVLDDRVDLDGWADRPAVVVVDAFGANAEYSYAELRSWVNRVGNALRDAAGVDVGSRVTCLASGDSLIHAATVLGTIKIGAQFHPVRPVFTALETGLPPVLNLARCPVFVITSDFEPRIKAMVARGDLPLLRCVLIIRASALSSNAPIDYSVASSSNPNGKVEFKDLGTLAQAASPQLRFVPPTSFDDGAIISTTSGTTGLPKLVLHGQTDYCIAADTYATHALRLTPNDVVASFFSCGGTYTLPMLLFFALRNGAKAILQADTSLKSVLCAFEKHKVTVVLSSPVKLNELETTVKGAPRFELPSSVRVLVTSGALLPLAQHQRIAKALGDKVAILDGIGASEMGHIFISNTVDKIVVGSVGRVMPGYRVELRSLEDSSVVVPVGEPGVMWATGSAALEYVGQRDLSRETFNGSTFMSKDLMRMDSDNNFYFMGRNDDLVKMAALNVSPTEIEALVGTLDYVHRSCLVTSTQDGGPTLFVELKQGAKQSVDTVTVDVANVVKRGTDEFKVPQRVRFVEEMPVTAALKLDRKRLRDTIV